MTIEDPLSKSNAKKIHSFRRKNAKKYFDRKKSENKIHAYFTKWQCPFPHSLFSDVRKLKALQEIALKARRLSAEIFPQYSSALIYPVYRLIHASICFFHYKGAERPAPAGNNISILRRGCQP